MNAAPRNAYRAKDGRYVSLSGSTQKMAERTLRAVGRADLIDDPRSGPTPTGSATPRSSMPSSARSSRSTPRPRRWRSSIRRRSRRVRSTTFRRSSSIPTSSSASCSPTIPTRRWASLPMHHVVPRLLGTPGSIRLPAPWLGQHNRELLEGVGIKGDAYQQLLDAGVVSESAAPQGNAARMSDALPVWRSLLYVPCPCRALRRQGARARRRLHPDRSRGQRSGSREGGTRGLWSSAMLAASAAAAPTSWCASTGRCRSPSATSRHRSRPTSTDSCCRRSAARITFDCSRITSPRPSCAAAWRSAIPGWWS